MNITMPGVANKTELYRGFRIDWQEPPRTSAGWEANITSEDRRLSALMGARPNTKCIRGRNQVEMLAEAKGYVDTLVEASIGNGTRTIRDLFLEALAKKQRAVSSAIVRDYLVDRGHDLAQISIDEVGNGYSWELTFSTGEKISFDGTDYHLVRR